MPPGSKLVHFWGNWLACSWRFILIILLSPSTIALCLVLPQLTPTTLNHCFISWTETYCNVVWNGRVVLPIVYTIASLWYYNQLLLYYTVVILYCCDIIVLWYIQYILWRDHLMLRIMLNSFFLVSPLNRELARPRDSLGGLSTEVWCLSALQFHRL